MKTEIYNILDEFKKKELTIIKENSAKFTLNNGDIIIIENLGDKINIFKNSTKNDNLYILPKVTNKICIK